MVLLSVRDLTKKYDDMTAVDHISFQIEKEDIYGLVGPNGAGKSTTINMISGLLVPDNGEILFEEQYRFQKWHEYIGLVPQDLAVYPDLSAEENAAFFASLYGLKGNVLKERVDEALKAVGLEEHRKKRVDKFSGGMKRRLNIACAIAHKPKLIIMDEPTVGIDPQSRSCILDSIRKLQEEGTTVIYTSHYMEEVEEICNKVLIIDHGKIILDGATSEVKMRFNKGKKLAVSTDTQEFDFEQLRGRLERISGISGAARENGAVTMYCEEQLKDYAAVFDAFMQLHIRICGIESKTPTLEEVFLSLTGKELRDE